MRKDTDGRRTAARASLNRLIAQGSELYRRELHLPRLLPIGHDTANPTGEQLYVIVQRLNHALRRERQKARSGHWTYDLNRHIALLQAYRAELRALGKMRIRPPSSAPAGPRRL